jgi:hypothetical protein
MVAAYHTTLAGGGASLLHAPSKTSDSTKQILPIAVPFFQSVYQRIFLYTSPAMSKPDAGKFRGTASHGQNLALPCRCGSAIHCAMVLLLFAG